MLEGDPVRGGLLYDTWWEVIAEGEETEEHGGTAGAPESDHPLWATQTTNTRSGADTWRCKECHGWDYKGAEGAYGSGSHLTGFIGVYASRDKPPNEVLAAMKGSSNSDHDFSTVLEEQDLVDLTLFITQALVDSDELVNPDNSSKGDATAGKTRYEEVCTKCHGPEGNAINFGALDEPEFLGHLAPDNPWEFIHKVRFGQPGWPMPSAITNKWPIEDVAGVLAYAQGFPAEAALSGGGQLYDKWWEELGLEEPTDNQPLWATQSTNTLSGADTWRCKECHGWDYKGAEGAYGSGSHFTGFPGILSAASMSDEELLGWLNGTANPEHDFSGVMEEFALKALVTFIKNEMADITPLVSADGTVTGDPANGRELYEGTCANCHGPDGKKMNFGSHDEPEYVGTIAADNPWEFFHKASFGHPGVPMPAGRAMGWTMEQIADILVYAQTLPTK
jgi:thiosulfate dehydrogenase